jgi:serine-type D-Ala-D-Ala carboxypeptidase/endopeptidase (penicillin-binding protein 4)
MTILLLILSVLLAGPLSAQALQGRMKPILKQNSRVHWGIHAVQVKTGKVLATMNADKFFIPASNTKLFSSSMALLSLGAGHRFATRVLAGSAPDAGGNLRGDLVLYGGGDPSLSSRRYPYDKSKAFEDDRLAPLRDLARQLKARGITRVGGNIVGDDTLWDFDPVPSGWGADDGVFEYGAPVSALTFNDNIFDLRLSAAGLELNPPVEYFDIANEVRFDPSQPRRIRVSRLPGERLLRISGNLPPGAAAYENQFAIDDPALYAAIAFRGVLIEEGIRVDGPAVARHQKPAQLEGVELARRESVPLSQIAEVTDKVSQNLYAELLLRSALQKTTLEEFLRQVGIDRKETNLEDGSGMSRLNLVSPQAIVQLLRFLALSGEGERFRSLLPIGAEDGTLRNRFDKNPKAKLIQAKTGSLSHVSALGGYAQSKKHGLIAFNIVANNYNVTAAEVRKAIDALALVLVQ